MPDLGIDVLFKGTNMLRLLQGLWVAMKISIVSILISMPLGILVGALMTVKNRFVKAIFRVYLEFIRIMPQLVLLSYISDLPEHWAGICPERWHPSSSSSCGAPQRWEIWCVER